MAAVVLDTTVVIDLLRNQSGAVARLGVLREAGDQPYVCAITVEETYRGARQTEREPTLRLFEGLRLAPLGVIEGRRAGDWRRESAHGGVTLAQADCLIAAAAVGIRGSLATGNPKDFPMEEVAVEHWPVGE
ncbi:MAG: PIN domain-containing protein [Solirubrobacterales bacterium]